MTRTGLSGLCLFFPYYLRVGTIYGIPARTRHQQRGFLDAQAVPVHQARLQSALEASRKHAKQQDGAPLTKVKSLAPMHVRRLQLNATPCDGTCLRCMCIRTRLEYARTLLIRSKS
ncbi:hypothetical protein ACQKWADRAFT_292201 [Trichoderma austrokoningii]